jgi:hypothetical protein
MGKKQSGFSHLMIITILLAIALIGTLGYVFYQNFLQSKSENTNSATKTSKITSKSTPKTVATNLADPSTSPTQSDLTQIAYDQSRGSDLALKYPSTWTMKHVSADPNNNLANNDTTDITSPDGSMTVEMKVGIDGIGGTCNPTDTTYRVSFIASTPLQNYSGYSLVEDINNYTNNGTYAYNIDVIDTAATSSLKVGGSPCDLGFVVFQSKTGNIATWVKLKFNDITNYDASTFSAVNDEMASSTYKTAKRIMLSLYEK